MYPQAAHIGHMIKSLIAIISYGEKPKSNAIETYSLHTRYSSFGSSCTAS